MYIAFKWLLGLSLAMWLAVCYVDFYVKKNEQERSGFNFARSSSVFKNSTDPRQNADDLDRLKFKSKNYSKFQTHGLAFLHYVMFIAGAIAVSLFNNKKVIGIYAKKRFEKIKSHLIIVEARKFCYDTYQKTSTRGSVIAIYQFLKHMVFKFTRCVISRLNKVILNFRKSSLTKNRHVFNLLLLKRIKELNEQNNNLGQLLIRAIKENKSLRVRCQLETMAKLRLQKQIEDSQTLSKESRSKNLSLQNLYLLTHQENSFLKARIKRILSENYITHKTLIALVDKVYESKNPNLINYCRRFIIDKKISSNSSILNEIQKFSDQSKLALVLDSSNNEPPYNNALIQECRSSTSLTEIIQQDDLITSNPEAPNLIGLPGDTWTGLQQRGFVEKFDYDPDHDDGDTIHRIREYSVYSDKGCLLDYRSSRTVINRRKSNVTLRNLPFAAMNHITDEKFLTGSVAFQKFLQSNMSAVEAPRPAPTSLCE